MAEAINTGCLYLLTFCTDIANPRTWRSYKSCDFVGNCRQLSGHSHRLIEPKAIVFFSNHCRVHYVINYYWNLQDSITERSQRPLVQRCAASVSTSGLPVNANRRSAHSPYSQFTNRLMPGRRVQRYTHPNPSSA